MHAWCYDEQAISLLKSLIPRKGELMRPVPVNNQQTLSIKCESQQQS